MKYILAIALALGVFIVAFSAFTKHTRANDNIENAEEKIQKLSEEIEINPSDVSLYIKRGALYNSIGKFAEAAADIQMQCDLEQNEDAKILCELELKEYKAQKGL